MREETNAPVSLELLEEYTGGDREFLIELTDQFWSDLDSRLPELQKSATSFDGAQLQGLSHAIAGSATCVGAEMLRQKALELEKCGREGQAQSAPELLSQFESELARVREFFEIYLR